MESPRDIDRLMDEDRVRAVLVIPEGHGRQLASGETAHVQVLLNGDNANTAATVMGYVMGIRAGRVQGSASRGSRLAMAAPVSVEPRVWYNPELRSTCFWCPGLIAYIAMLTAVVSTALSVVKEKERGTLEQIRMAPLGAAPYIIGKSLPYFVLSLISALLIVLASMALFDLPMRGSWWALLLAVSLFLFGAIGTGLLISTIADSQQMAFQLALLIAFLPTLMLSGSSSRFRACRSSCRS